MHLPPKNSSETSPTRKYGILKKIIVQKGKENSLLDIRQYHKITLVKFNY